MQFRKMQLFKVKFKSQSQLGFGATQVHRSQVRLSPYWASPKTVWQLALSSDTMTDSTGACKRLQSTNLAEGTGSF